MSAPVRPAAALAEAGLYAPTGRVLDAFGTVIRADLPGARIGEICRLDPPATSAGGDLAPELHEAQVVGLRDGAAILAPLGPLKGVGAATRIRLTGRGRTVRLGAGLLGRVLDGYGRPIDDGPPPAPLGPPVPVEVPPPPPLSRRPIERPFPVGLRVIDGVLTMGEGQRVGLFGAPGGGKSTLLGALVRGARADACVVALVGERGREVGETVRDVLGTALPRCVVVAATSDRPAVERASAAVTATRIAEGMRDEGARVLLVVDSLTRHARALREIGLAAGEPPARRGFPASVFDQLPALLERGGMGARGSITAVHTVLVEDEGEGDPVAEEVRGILDGHVVLSSELAAKGHYPAVDVARSKSRVMPAVTSEAHRAAASRLLALWAKLEEVGFLVQVGEYAAGADPLADAALFARPAIEAFLRQGQEEASTFEETVAALARIAA